MSESFIDIVGFEHMYQIDESGTVKNKLRNTVLRASKRGQYLRVKLFVNNYRTYHSVHRLVAINFIPNPNNYPCVLHINNNTLDNRVVNLKWGTHSHNNIQAIKEGRRKNKKGIKCPHKSGEKNPRSIFTNVQILAIRDALNSGHGLSEIGKYFKTSRGTIWKIKVGYSYASV